MIRKLLAIGLSLMFALAVNGATAAPPRKASDMHHRSIVSEASHYNAMSSLLYRWWGLFEAPRGTDVTPFLADLFDDNVRIKMTGVDLTGIAAAKAALAALPNDDLRAHQLKSLTVTDLGDGKFKLDASFIYQTQPAGGKLRSGEGFYSHTARLRPDGRMVFTEMTAHLGQPVDMPEFVPTYIDHRAKAVVIDIQTVMDTLSGDASRFHEMMRPDVVLEGLVAPPKGARAKPDQWNATLRGYDDLARWFAEGPKVFYSNSHRLETFSVKPLGSNRYEAVAQFDWVAVTHDGQKFEKHTPRTWILVDGGEKYMRVEKSF